MEWRAHSSRRRRRPWDCVSEQSSPEKGLFPSPRGRTALATTARRILAQARPKSFTRIQTAKPAGWCNPGLPHTPVVPT